LVATPLAKQCIVRIGVATPWAVLSHGSTLVVDFNKDFSDHFNKDFLSYYNQPKYTTGKKITA
jgi:hypothetical protein